MDDNIITNININDLNKNKSIKIKYSIVKSQNIDNKNKSEKSSMDGSIDEIISKKLKQVHDNNEKYAQRILKAYNQVKFFKSYSLEKSKYIKNSHNNNYHSNNFFNNDK